jgi:hypothetical protein
MSKWDLTLTIYADLVFTCFPARWGQPKRDPLNLFDGLIEDINSKTKPPVRSVFELAALITDRCTGTFDRHHWGNEDYLFLEMFELSIGTMVSCQGNDDNPLTSFVCGPNTPFVDTTRDSSIPAFRARLGCCSALAEDA